MCWKEMVGSANRRVVVTGMGLISPLGSRLDEFWAALSEGRSGVAPFVSLPTVNLPIHYAGEARGFKEEVEDFGELDKATKRNINKGLKVMCREIAMGVASAQLALQNAGLNASNIEPERTGVVYGSDYIMTLPTEFTAGVLKCIGPDKRFDFNRWAEEGLPEVSPLWLLKYLPNMPASHIAIYNDLRGPSNSITMREASTNLSLAEAYCTINRGAADTLVCGATGTRVHPVRTLHVILQEQLADGAFEPAQASRPFDRDRQGMVVGEGAGCLVLEELEHAQKRGAKIYGEVIGYGSSTVMTRRGLADCAQALQNVMASALRTSGLKAKDIGHIHAHGLSTQQGDIDEAKAIGAIFGSPKESPPVVAAKSYFGNLGAGSGAVELIASLLAFEHNRLFPVLNYSTPDPDCPVRAVRPGESAPPGDVVLSTNVTPQGQAGAILVRRFK